MALAYTRKIIMDYVTNDRCKRGRERPVLQVLVPACQAGSGYAWLNGYCVLSCRADGNDVVISGEVRIGEHIADNPGLIASLANALDPAAVLVGMDLTGMVSSLGRLPIDAPDQAPALALLTKLRSMLEMHSPIDLGQPDGDALDSLNAHLLAETLADHASDCLLEATFRTLADVSAVKLYASWQAWRQSLVPVMPEKEVPQNVDA